VILGQNGGDRNIASVTFRVQSGNAAGGYSDRALDRGDKRQACAKNKFLGFANDIVEVRLLVGNPFDQGQ